MDQILMLKQDHGLEIPDLFYFQYAEVLQQIGLYEAAVEALTRYLTLAGQDGEHYQAALTMLIEGTTTVLHQSWTSASGFPAAREFM